MGNKFREKLIQFMYGRYGADELSRFSFAAWFILIILNIFLRSSIITVIELLLIILIYYRILSRKTEQRRAENAAYLKQRNKVTGFFRIQKLKFRDRKTHCYRKCPVCKKMLRLPKRKGQHTVCCPQCRNDFQVKI